MTQPTPAPLSAEEIERLKELEARQDDPAPWEVLCADLRYRDWTFICESRNALPRLLATIDALQSERNDMREYIHDKGLGYEFQDWRTVGEMMKQKKPK